jgi:hypothetical protein
VETDLDSSKQMEDPNEAFRGQAANGAAADVNGFPFAPTPGHNPNFVSLPSSSTSSHGNVNVHARPQTNANTDPSTGHFKTEPGAGNAEDPWGVSSNPANANQTFPQTIHPQGSQNWPPAPFHGNEYVQAYGFPGGLDHGLPVFPNNQQPFPPPFDLGQAVDGLPNLDSSSSTSGRINGSSPTTVFGSFSSSVGPPDMTDMNTRDECFHSRSVFPSEAPPCHNHGAIPQAFLSHSPMHQAFPMRPRGVFPEADTVSPEMLHLNSGGPNLPSSSSPESLPHPLRMDSDSEATSPLAVPQERVLPSSGWQPAHESGNNDNDNNTNNNSNNNNSNSSSSTKINSAGRKQLPDKAPHSKASSSRQGRRKRRHGGDVVGDKTLAPCVKKPKPRAAAKAATQPLSSSSSSSQHHSRNQQAGGQDDRPKATSSSSSSSQSKASSSSSKAAAAAAAAPASSTGGGGSSSRGAAAAAVYARHRHRHRSEKDEYLVQSKLRGMTYKEIRKQGGFTEAESTLRGRFRTLTKPKEQRVRKPEFQEVDVSFVSIFFPPTYILLSMSALDKPPGFLSTITAAHPSSPPPPQKSFLFPTSQALIPCSPILSSCT